MNSGPYVIWYHDPNSEHIQDFLNRAAASGLEFAGAVGENQFGAAMFAFTVRGGGGAGFDWCYASPSYAQVAAHTTRGGWWVREMPRRPPDYFQLRAANDLVFLASNDEPTWHRADWDGVPEGREMKGRELYRAGSRMAPVTITGAPITWGSLGQSEVV